MAKGLVKVGMGVTICLALWLTLWSLKPKVRNNERIIGQFSESSSLITTFDKPSVKQVDLFLVALVTQAPQDASVMIEWSLSSTGDASWFTNRVHTLVPGTNRINLTGPGNIALVRNIMHGQQRITVNIRVFGPKYFTPLSLGMQWMELRRFYDP
jgi:hypothetical protein